MSKELFDDIIVEIKGDEMPSLARVWRDEGRNEGRDEGRIEGINIGVYSSIKMGLEVKFNNFSEKLLSSIEKITDIDKLKEIQKAIFMIDNRDEFEQFIKKI